MLLDLLAYFLCFVVVITHGLAFIVTMYVIQKECEFLTFRFLAAWSFAFAFLYTMGVIIDFIMDNLSTGYFQGLYDSLFGRSNHIDIGPMPE